MDMDRELDKAVEQSIPAVVPDLPELPPREEEDDQSLVSNRRRVAAYHALDRILEQELPTYEVSAKEQMQAAAMVLDRSDPKVQHNLNVDVMATFTEVRLELVGGAVPVRAEVIPLERGEDGKVVTVLRKGGAGAG